MSCGWNEVYYLGMSFESEVEALKKSGIPEKLTAWRIIVVATEKVDFYCCCNDDLLFAYPGIEAFGSFMQASQMAKEEDSPLVRFNHNIIQDYMLIDLGQTLRLVRKHPLHKPEYMKDTAPIEELCHNLCKAKSFFDQYASEEEWFKAISKSEEMDSWMAKVSPTGSVEPFEVSKLSIPVTWPASNITDVDRIAELKKKRQEGTVVKVATFYCPTEIEGIYPLAQVLFDDTHKTIIDGHMVSDYDSEYATLACKFIQYCVREGLPHALVSRDLRSYYLYHEIASKLEIKMALDQGEDKEMDILSTTYAHAMDAIIHRQEEEEGHHCCHHHDHGGEHHCHHHEHGEDHECCHHHEHGGEHHCCHHHEDGHECHHHE